MEIFDITTTNNNNKVPIKSWWWGTCSPLMPPFLLLCGSFSEPKLASFQPGKEGTSPQAAVLSDFIPSLQIDLESTKVLFNAVLPALASRTEALAVPDWFSKTLKCSFQQASISSFSESRLPWESFICYYNPYHNDTNLKMSASLRVNCVTKSHIHWV